MSSSYTPSPTHRLPDLGRGIDLDQLVIRGVPKLIPALLLRLAASDALATFPEDLDARAGGGSGFDVGSGRGLGGDVERYGAGRCDDDMGRRRRGRLRSRGRVACVLERAG